MNDEIRIKTWSGETNIFKINELKSFVVLQNNIPISRGEIDKLYEDLLDDQKCTCFDAGKMYGIHSCKKEGEKLIIEVGLSILKH